MKKLSFIFAMVLAASFAMAQVPDFTTPGAQLITKINYDPFTTNTINSDQKGDNNDSKVTQNGVNSAVVAQISIAGATLGQANIATLSQDGKQNFANIDQNRSGGQQGSSTVSTGIQTGNKNYMNIIQDGHYQGGNTSTVKQYGVSDENAIGNQADVNHQMGYGNNWIINQTGDDNRAQQVSNNSVVSGTTNKIYQFGISNKATQETAGGDAMFATIEQGTDQSRVSGNIAKQVQGGLKSNASISQWTSNNQAYQTQVNGSYFYNNVYASQHDAKITQEGGEGNYAFQFQTENVDDVWANSRNKSVVSQDGNRNRAEVAQMDGLNEGNITQSSDDNQAKLIQYGLGNFSEILQTGSVFNKVNLTQKDGATANIVQNGEHNTLMGLVNDEMATSYDKSDLDLDQVGNYNVLHLQQDNAGIADVDQLGSHNTLVVIQN
ncbi:MAG: hypothetical protein PHT07_04190 [Paludibacter sp.]|nr:hypothetical protein [Paludibacter sp.]